MRDKCYLKVEVLLLVNGYLFYTGLSLCQLFITFCICRLYPLMSCVVSPLSFTSLFLEMKGCISEAVMSVYIKLLVVFTLFLFFRFGNVSSVEIVTQWKLKKRRNPLLMMSPTWWNLLSPQLLVEVQDAMNQS